MQKKPLSISHYNYIQLYGKQLSSDLGVADITEILVAHGDKAYTRKEEWEVIGLPFPKGVMMYLLTKQRPYADLVRSTPGGWVDPFAWIKTEFINGGDIRSALDKLPDFA